MRKLPRPNFTAEEVFKVSISKVRNAHLKARLEACLPEIIQDSLDFDNRATSAQLHLIPKRTHVNGDVSKDEMEKVYTGRMVNKKGPARLYYNKLRYPKAGDKCPFCGQRPVSTLDHYLAKTDYPSLVVSPNNLVPACKDCNFIKNSISPTKSEEETLHPYFDSLDEGQWIYASVNKTFPVSISYFIKAPPYTTLLQLNRVKHHFKLYDLATLYKSEAASELSDIAYQMNKLLLAAGSEAVKQHLREIAESCSYNQKNSWKTAMYQALAADSWYCEVGALLYEFK